MGSIIFSFRNFRKAFTLIELMIVISIIGVLTVALIPQMSQYMSRSRDAERMSNIGNIQIALDQYKKENKIYPTHSGGCVPTNTLITNKYLTKSSNSPSGTGYNEGCGNNGQFGFGNKGGNGYIIMAMMENTRGGNYSGSTAGFTGNVTASGLANTKKIVKGTGSIYLRVTDSVIASANTITIDPPETGLCGVTANTCIVGMPTGYSPGACGGSKTWTCDGLNGGISAVCSLVNPACSIDGACGTADAVDTSTAPTTNLCTTGTATSVSTTATGFLWICNGISGGVPDSCAADRIINRSCAGKPANSSWNTGTTVNQTWNGTTWTPTQTGSYSVTASATTCKFKCNAGYVWSGTTSTCLAVVNGACGTADAVDTSTAPTTNLCGSGTATSVTTTATGFTWSCNGVNGGIADSCAADKIITTSCIGKPTYAIWNTATSIYQTWNGTTWTPTQTGSYDTTSSATTCKFKCNAGYNWNGTTCVAATGTGTCLGLPANAIWNTVSNITQTWNGTTWTPTQTGSYSVTASTTNCIYKCATNYAWNGTSCIAGTQVASCAGKPANSSWNTGTTVNQTWNGTTWTPTQTGSYSVTASATTCKFKCNAGYVWSGTTSTCLAVVNGACGTADAVDTSTAPTTNLCGSGTATSVTTTATGFTWSCNGVNGGIADSCAADKIITTSCAGKPTNSSWNTGTTVNQTWNGTTWTPTQTGSYSVTTSATTCKFKCNAGYGWSGTTNACTAITNGLCGGSDGGSFSTKPTTNLCTTGTPTTVTGSGLWTWSCIGAGGGTTDTCSATWSCANDITIGDIIYQSCNTITNPWKHYAGLSSNSTSLDANGWRYGALYSLDTVDTACSSGYHPMTSSEIMYAYKKLSSNWETVRTNLGFPYAGTWDASTSTYGYRGTSSLLRLIDDKYKLSFIGGTQGLSAPADVNNGYSARCIKNDQCYTIPTSRTAFSNPLYGSTPIWIGMGVNANDISLGDPRSDTSAQRTLGTAWCQTQGYDCGKVTANAGGFYGNIAVYNPVTKTWAIDSDNDHVNATKMDCWNIGMVNGACGSADGVPTATVPTTNLCTTGNETTVTTNTGTYTWSCSGVNGGTTDSCTANRQKVYACAAKPTIGTAWNTVSSYTQTWSGSAWLPANSTTAYNATASTTSCRYKCASGYAWDGANCIPTINGVCGSANGVATASYPTANWCTTGTKVDVDTAGSDGAYNWSCNGSAGGANVSCSANKGISCSPYKACAVINSIWGTYDCFTTSPLGYYYEFFGVGNINSPGTPGQALYGSQLNYVSPGVYDKVTVGPSVNSYYKVDFNTNQLWAVQYAKGSSTIPNSTPFTLSLCY